MQNNISQGYITMTHILL